MKPFFDKVTVAASDTRRLSECNVVRVYSVSGTVTLSFNKGNQIPVIAGEVFHAGFAAVFDEVVVTTGGGAAATIIYGQGGISNVAASAGGGSGGVQSTSGDPEGVLDATNGQWAYDTATGALYVNAATSGTTGWVNLIA